MVVLCLGVAGVSGCWAPTVVGDAVLCPPRRWWQVSVEVRDTRTPRPVGDVLQPGLVEQQEAFLQFGLGVEEVPQPPPPHAHVAASDAEVLR